MNTTMRQLSQITIGPAEDAILRALVRYPILTNDQLCHLLYSDKSIAWLRKKTHALVAAGYLEEDVIPRPTRHGSSPSYFWLGRKAVAYLREYGFPDLLYYPSREGDKSYLFLQHALAINDVVIASELLCRSYPLLALEDVKLERALKRMPMKVEVKDEKVSIIPDAWLAFSSAYVLLEVDRGSEEGAAIKRKIRAYANALRNPLIDRKNKVYGPSVYNNLFNANAAVVAFVVFPGKVGLAARVAALKRWTEEELKDSLKLAGLFLFTSSPGNPPDPHDLFLSPRWYEPFSDIPVSLLEA